MRRAIACLCLWQLVCVGVLGAQANRATITGTVTDSSGALVAGVEVTAKNLGTNVLTSTVTNADGIYSIPNLFPGTYSVEFKKTAFKPLAFPSITLESTQVAQMNTSGSCNRDAHGNDRRTGT